MRNSPEGVEGSCFARGTLLRSEVEVVTGIGAVPDARRRVGGGLCGGSHFTEWAGSRDRAARRSKPYGEQRDSDDRDRDDRANYVAVLHRWGSRVAVLS